MPYPAALGGRLMRAPRFALKLPVRYRFGSDPRWREGVTENISYSGVLFRAEGLIDVNTPIELRVALPIDVQRQVHPEVFCQARIVRSVAPSVSDPRPGLAASIEQYQFVRPQIGTA